MLLTQSGKTDVVLIEPYNLRKTVINHANKDTNAVVISATKAKYTTVSIACNNKIRSDQKNQVRLPEESDSWKHKG